MIYIIYIFVILFIFLILYYLINKYLKKKNNEYFDNNKSKYNCLPHCPTNNKKIIYKTDINTGRGEEVQMKLLDRDMPSYPITTWTPYYVDIYNQPGYTNYFYNNGYMYPIF